MPAKWGAGGGDGEFEPEFTDLFDGFDGGEPQCFGAQEEDGLALDGGKLATGNVVVVGTRPGFELIEGGDASDGESHAVGAVVGLHEFADDDVVGLGEGGLIAGGEFGFAGGGVVEFAADVEHASQIVLHVTHGFVVHGIDSRSVTSAGRRGAMKH